MRTAAAARQDGPPRRWIQHVARVAKEFEPDDEGTCSVYVILLQRADEFGVYVGQTGKDVAERYLDHTSGHKSSKHVREHSVRVLDEVGKHLRGRFSRAEAENVEAKLAERLTAEGFWVEGGH